jgi:hypothetical protein
MFSMETSNVERDVSDANWPIGSARSVAGIVKCTGWTCI